MQLAKRRWDHKIHPLTVVRCKLYDSAQIKEQDEEAEMIFLYVFMYREFLVVSGIEFHHVSFKAWLRL